MIAMGKPPRPASGYRGAWVATLLGAVAVLYACGSVSNPPPPPSAAETLTTETPAAEDAWSSKAVEESRKARTTFGRTSLQDGIVTRAEYEQSVRALMECGKSNGQPIEADLHYGLYVFSAHGAAGSAVFEACVEGDIGAVQSIYYGQFTDPQNRGQIVTSECLVRLGVLPAGYHFQESTFETDVDRILQGAPTTSSLHQNYEKCMYNPLDRPG
jgi:hypothetical protein